MRAKLKRGAPESSAAPRSRSATDWGMTDMDGMQKHLVCNGSGRVPGARNGSHGVKAICGDCGGHGIRRAFGRALDSNKPKWSRPDAEGRQTCLACQGQGQKTGDDRDCASCDGEGYRWR